ncbi:dipeptide ABC transporter ATP-binding protein [Brevibacillus sp. AG]|uniref:Dipeptide ABC transporter ATP-binding protein n=2 Tax=Brevibacillus porteri TaxID=2126350 RepID=A0ABX5FU94_9BACL|nr:MULTISPECIES: dipeptide ABC transporter ATP-binding protein [Brevibacillus]ATF13176.1 dipeptide ABC transporter ATP-binding protein [Brevibacillus brevis X23]MDC0759681.1 dipeptide ABC transporter ATP-binding protein [Brevibacillus sp. AG]MED1799352.1 dipeptide ABC transporter ATP-binding protein [Brevibacillus porteri]MED2132260.1 dipeptide ABC transporter ATP-binding protein [Brevibacillus porteri]PSK11998.1 dipeptide ABC transporter ATP-binding protein [Brevibacillus porteri]
MNLLEQSECKPLLEVRGLKKYFPIRSGLLKKVTNHVKAVDDLSFTVATGETLGIVGESGCGKSTTGRAILRLLEPTGGEVIFQGENLAALSPNEMRMKRKDLQIIFQDPFASLNPRMTVGEIIEEPMIIFELYETSKERKEKVAELMQVVGLKSENSERFPHEFSGGQRQRIGIARALALNPKLIVADEPVSALDVSIQSQVLNLMRDLQKQYGLTYIFISHNLSVVKHFCDRIGVMYLGRMVELAPKNALYEEPLHPYTRSLLSAVPIAKPKMKRERIILTGDVPSPANPPSGCTFHTRCPDCMEICKTDKPEFQSMGDGRYVACHLYNQ